MIRKALDTVSAAAATTSSETSDFFCDPMTWQFWLDPFSFKLTSEEDVGVGPASAILGPEIIANRSNGFVTAALREEVTEELAALKDALPADARARLANVTVETNVSAPLAAQADRRRMVVTLSESLVRYAFIRAVVAHGSAAIVSLERSSRHGDKDAAVAGVIDSAANTVAAFRTNLAFILAHELAHVWVPTLDEREADCHALETVFAERGLIDLGIFASIEEALAEDRSDYWNGLPRDQMRRRLDLIGLWRRAATSSSTLHAVCIEASKEFGD